MTSEGAQKNDLVYLIERHDGDFYAVDIARRLVSAEEMTERVAQEKRDAPSEPLTPEELRALDEGFLVHPQDLTQPSAWKDWLIYERMDGKYVKCPPSAHPEVQEMSKNMAFLRLQGRLEDELERFQERLRPIIRAAKDLKDIPNKGDEPVFSLKVEFY